MANHTIDTVCPVCGYEYDTHLYMGTCPYCAYNTANGDFEKLHEQHRDEPRKPGDTFSFHNVTLQVVEQSSCYGCYFNRIGDNCQCEDMYYNYVGSCVGRIFKKVEDKK